LGRKGLKYQSSKAKATKHKPVKQQSEALIPLGGVG